MNVQNHITAVWLPTLVAALCGCALEVEEEPGLVTSQESALGSQVKVATICDTGVETCPTISPDWSDQGVLLTRGQASGGSDGDTGALYYSTDTLVWWGGTGSILALKQDYPYTGRTFLVRGSSLYIWSASGDIKLADIRGSVDGPLAVDSSRVYCTPSACCRWATRSRACSSRRHSACTRLVAAWRWPTSWRSRVRSSRWTGC